MSTSNSSNPQEQLTAILDLFNNDQEQINPGMVKDLLLTIMMDAMSNPHGTLLDEKKHGFTIYQLHQIVLHVESLIKPTEFRTALEKQLRRYGMDIKDLHSTMVYAIDRGQEGRRKYDREMTMWLRKLWIALGDGSDIAK